MDNKTTSNYEIKMVNQLKAGDKVKIDVDKYQWKKGSYTPEFLQWLEDNRNTIFTLVPHLKGKVMWGLEEDPRWLIYNDDLIKVIP